MSKLKQEINKEKILEVLSSVTDNDNSLDVVSSGIISSVVVRGDSVGFAIEVDINKASEKETLRKQCEDAVKQIAGVNKVTVVLTSAQPGVLSEQKEPIRQKKKETETDSRRIPEVKEIIIVASGKGGVGKSTVAVNLAKSLQKSGSNVAIVDLDIYGPSVPKMLGLEGQPEVDKNNRMIPKDADGLKSISVGYLVENDRAIVWRSSMALKAMTQLLRGVNWENIDYLIIDTPPGTGDIQLSLAKNFAISGVVMVSTPQDMALIDVKRAVNMFEKVQVPIIGLVENMSYFEDETGKKNYIFGEGGAKQYAQEAGINILGEIPIKQDLREASDSGKQLDNFTEMDEIVSNFKKEMEKK